MKINRPIRYDVIDTKTGMVIKSYTGERAGVNATKFCDKKDREYGAIRYYRRPVWK